MQKTKDMKTCGAISLVVTAESTAQKCMLLTRNIKVVIENGLSKRFTIRYLLKQDNFDSIQIAIERTIEREREREREILNSSINNKGARNCGSRSKLTAHCYR